MDDQEFQAELARRLEEEVPKRRQAEAHGEIDALLRQAELVREGYLRASDLYHGAGRHATRMSALERMAELLTKLTEIARGLSEVPAEHRRSHAGFAARFLSDEAGSA